MRLVSALLFVALTGSAVLADEAKPADPKPEVTKKKVPFRVVKMLPETGQVLLYDKNKGTHVVAEVGQTLDGYSVQDIDDDEVTLVAENGTQVILTAPAPKKRVVKKAADAAPVDPYGEEAAPVAADDTTLSKASATKPAGAAPVDPYADPEPPAAPGEGGVRVASAPAGTTAPAMADPASPAADPYGDPGIAAFAAAVGATPATPAVHEASASGIDANAGAHAAGKTKGAKVKAGKTGKAAPTTDDGAALAAAATGGEAPAPSAITTTATGSTATSGAATAAGPAGSATVIARSELDRALGDFGKLAGSFRATFTPDGLRFDAVNDGTLLATAGLRKGDVVTAVDGQPLRSMDDAANLYARAGSVKSTTIKVVRAGKPVTLRVAIQ